MRLKPGRELEAKHRFGRRSVRTIEVVCAWCGCHLRNKKVARTSTMPESVPEVSHGICSGCSREVLAT